MQFALYGNNGENNPGKIIIDNMFMKVVDAEDGELTVYKFAGEKGNYSFVYNNLSSAAKEYQFIIAKYNKLTGEFLGADVSKNGSFNARSTGVISSSLSSDPAAESNIEYRVFLWKNFETLEPITTSLTEK